MKRTKYYCPKCKAVVTSSVPLEYCICGGKYGPFLSSVNQFFKDCGFLDGEGENMFSDLFKTKKK